MLDATTDLPAIAGGTPAKHTPFQKASRYGAEELAHLEEALQQGTLFYAHGKKVAELEKQFAAKIGATHAIASSSGTAAIHIAMIALGVSPGDEVIVPPITDIGSIVPILWQGAIPVFADLDPHTYNLSPQAVRDRISDRTRAVLAVHLAGNACDLGELKKICQERNIALIEDWRNPTAARTPANPSAHLALLAASASTNSSISPAATAGFV